MDIFENYNKLLKSPEFKSLKDAYLFLVLILFEDKPENIEFMFYRNKRFYSFRIGKAGITKQQGDYDREPEKLELEEPDFKKAMNKSQLMLKHYNVKNILKTMFIIESKNKKMLYNITYFLKDFNVLNVKLDSELKIMEHSLKPLFFQ